MNLQELLGADYVEGMSIDAINNALSTRKFADLSTGQYVDKNKYNTYNPPHTIYLLYL